MNIQPVSTVTCVEPPFKYKVIEVEKAEAGDFFNWRNPHRGVKQDYWEEIREPILKKIKEGGDIFIVVQKIR